MSIREGLGLKACRFEAVASIRLSVSVKMDKCPLCGETKTVLLLRGGMVLCKTASTTSPTFWTSAVNRKVSIRIEEELTLFRRVVG